MDLYCTRPGCPSPLNRVDIDEEQLRSISQIHCRACQMPLILAGAYLPIKPLGQGGFGATFLAVDRYLPNMEHCVVKHFRPEGMNEEEIVMARRLFTREATVLQKVGNDHDAIPDLYAYFPMEVTKLGQSHQTQEHFYLVQEYIDGEDLEHELQRLGAYDEGKVIELLKSLLPILEFVHGRNIIHRDIKPANIMRHRQGKIYLLDFGAVRDLFSTSKWTTVGTTGYAAPEQYHGGDVYPSTDLYGLGVTCLRLLTGLPPEDLYDAYQGVWKWQDRVRLSRETSQILDRMVRLVVQERFKSANDVLAELHGLPRRVQLPPSSKPLRPALAPQATPMPVVTPLPLPLAQPTPGVLLGQIFLIAAEVGLWVMVAVVKLAAPVGVSLLLGALLGGWVWFWGRTWLRVPWLAGLWLASFILLVGLLPGAGLRLGLGSLTLGLITLGIVTLGQWLRQSLR
ncbi:protein kinase; PknA [Gloeomargarita lithophora Alchichica-D10]|uniref:non-specific serine/threonine protein kinase n=1 Tax=Gloeomargarita lithophora Alchichica-D10 TaxID=1188229 RepID=A0A1J0ACI4_9CYAN|nr:serine/threonine-protein kinase [Gloeomargarita lithophora]APB33624.1 protein kinase; PknA [Gloeomargarita lithophora Alchichica-D10]